MMDPQRPTLKIKLQVGVPGAEVVESRVVTPEELIDEVKGMGPMDAVLLHPLMGGLAPAFSWECLRLIESKVLPAIR